MAHARKLNTPTKEGNQPRNEKDEPEDSDSEGEWWRVGEKLRHVPGYIKIDQHVFTSWYNWGSSGLQALAFPSLPPFLILNISTFGIST